MASPVVRTPNHSHRSESNHSNLNSQKSADSSNKDADNNKMLEESNHKKIVRQASSKTLSSFYPESPEHHLKKKMPACVDEVENSDSDISAKIAALIMPP